MTHTGHVVTVSFCRRVANETAWEVLRKLVLLETWNIRQSHSMQTLEELFSTLGNSGACNNFHIEH